MDVPENAPEHCPGTGSEAAGKTSACAGCPNQKICASGETAGPDPDIPVIRDKLAPIKHKIVVLSGKGGVGKTSVTAMLARGFARRYPSSNVAVLDVDICGPSMPRVMGVEGEAVHVSGAGWSPVSVDDNVCMMSIGFLLESLDDAVVWRGPKKNGLIKQFLRDVDWGTSTDYLLIDTPPGTSDEHLSVVQYLIPAKPDGAVIVTTPQEVSLLDVRKEINFCRKVGLPIIGVVENMSGFACPKCDKESEIFPALTGGAKKMCQDMGIRFLGKLPLDPRIGQYCDQGTDFFEDCAESPAAIAYQKVLDGIDRSCTQNAESSAGDAV